MIRALEKAESLKARLRRGEPCIGAQISLSDPAVAEIFGRVGYHWLLLDTEHTANSPSTLCAMLQATAHSKSVLLARALALEPDQIRRFLDIGASGIVCPFINNGEQAHRLVQASRYPPLGNRGYGPRRASNYGLDSSEYFNTINEAVICIPMIESAEAVSNIDDIITVDGIDAVCVGPMDLSISLGVFRQFEHSDYVNAIEKVRRACHRHHKAMGTGCYSLEHAKQCAAAGDRLLLIGDDDDYLATEASRWFEALNGPHK